MKSATAHLDKARSLLAEAKYLLAGGYIAGAGRDAYLVGLHAALALVVHRTQREPKTHTGASSEFSRLARAEPQIEPELISFLGRSYPLKSWADYDDSEPITSEEVTAALDLAARMVTVIATLLSASGSPEP